jgi:hypothetical protein
VQPEPTARRPRFPGYGIAEDADGILAWDWAVERLSASRNYWISTAGPDGRLHAMPVWGAWWKVASCSVRAGGRGRGLNVACDPRVVLHLESGDEVVILERVVDQLRDREKLGAVA